MKDYLFYDNMLRFINKSNIYLNIEKKIYLIKKTKELKIIY